MSEAPEMEDTSAPGSFQRIVSSMSARLALLPHMAYDDLYAELSQLSVSMTPNPTLESMTNDLMRIQMSKDRICEILKDAIVNHHMHKRVSDILVKGWQKFSSEKSKDTREADAMMRMSQFLMAAGEAESFFKTACGIQANLHSQYDTISRQITCFNMMMKIGESMYYEPGSMGPNLSKPTYDKANGYAPESEEEEVDWDSLE
jgi:hypothetical protein